MPQNGTAIMAGNNRIMIFGPKSDGTYVVEFRSAAGETLAISIPASEAAWSGTFRTACPTACSYRTCRSLSE